MPIHTCLLLPAGIEVLHSLGCCWHFQRAWGSSASGRDHSNPVAAAGCCISLAVCCQQVLPEKRPKPQPKPANKQSVPQKPAKPKAPPVLDFNPRARAP